MEQRVLAIERLAETVETPTCSLELDILIEFVPAMEQGLELLLKNDYLLVVINADTVDYLHLLKLMREMKPMPILVFTSNYDEQEMIEALHRGADAYLPHPNTIEGCTAIEQALIRRCSTKHNETPNTN